MKKNILIIGGMGPQASLLLHERILDKAAQLGAVNGADFPAITHLSLPIDDFISDQTKAPKALRMIKERLYCLWQPEIYARYNCLQYGSHPG